MYPAPLPVALLSTAESREPCADTASHTGRETRAVGASAASTAWQVDDGRGQSNPASGWEIIKPWLAICWMMSCLLLCVY